MGLDMYLSRKKFIGANYEHRNVTGSIDIKIGEKTMPIKFDRLSYIEESVGYWRKANAIHNWFVNNVQGGEDDCKQYYVSIDQLEELLKVCKEVKEKAIIKKGTIKNGMRFENGKWEPITEDGEYIENAEEIEGILPTASGCFFGSTDYDQWYMQDIDKTIELIEEILKDEEEMKKAGFNWETEYVYQASW